MNYGTVILITQTKVRLGQAFSSQHRVISVWKKNMFLKKKQNMFFFFFQENTTRHVKKKHSFNNE